ncbi:hypothetical protein DWUX_1758 [Desulfovibrio diazotrophicus]|nr:hypothetical protein DWUX_1758 [Desulfovibrio diazotrophicus]VVU42924.1 hypothetical protein DWUX_270 [Desulfovibrio diazotrophicus]
MVKNKKSPAQWRTRASSLFTPKVHLRKHSPRRSPRAAARCWGPLSHRNR